MIENNYSLLTPVFKTKKKTYNPSTNIETAVMWMLSMSTKYIKPLKNKGTESVA